LLLTFLPRLTAPFRRHDIFSDQAIECKDVGYWIRDNFPKDIRLMSRVAEVAFYAERKGEEFPYKDLPGLLQYAKERKVDYIVVDKRWFARLMPDMAFLLDEGRKIEGLKLIYRWDKRPEYKVLIYKLDR
jgi:hypothetical protein